jgi:hypothetical protein
MDVLFVYYRVSLEHRDRAIKRVTDVQLQVTSRCEGIAARLMRRPNSDASSETWLEVYEPVTADVEALVEGLAKSSGLIDLIGARAIERFSETE